MKEIVNVYSLRMVKEREVNYEVGNKKVVSAFMMAELLDEVFEMGSLPEEILVLACLDTKNEIVGMFKVSQGSLNSSIVHPREVFKRAMLCNANCIMLAHNHPSGDTTPSREDLDITKRIKKAGELMGIHLLDHLIIGHSRYLSFKEEKLI